MTTLTNGARAPRAASFASAAAEVKAWSLTEATIRAPEPEIAPYSCASPASLSFCSRLPWLRVLHRGMNALLNPVLRRPAIDPRSLARFPYLRVAGDHTLDRLPQDVASLLQQLLLDRQWRQEFDHDVVAPGSFDNHPPLETAR